MITLTSAASEEVKRLIDKESKPNMALRVSIQGGGCSGMSYVLAFDEATPKPHDELFEQDGVKVLVDAKSHLYINGMTIDYKPGLVGGGFEFNNPNAKQSCGCGTSFSA